MSHYPHFHTHYNVTVTVLVDNYMKDCLYCLYTLTTNVNSTMVIIALIVIDIILHYDHHLYYFYLDRCSCCFVSL